MATIEMTKEILRPKRMKHNQEQPLKWQDLKELLNSLPDEQLQQDVVWWGDERGGSVHAVLETQDELINPSGEGCEPRTLYTQSEDESEREIGDTEEIAYPKGQLILLVD